MGWLSNLFGMRTEARPTVKLSLEEKRKLNSYLDIIFQTLNVLKKSDLIGAPAIKKIDDFYKQCNNFVGILRRYCGDAFFETRQLKQDLLQVEEAFADLRPYLQKKLDERSKHEMMMDYQIDKEKLESLDKALKSLRVTLHPYIFISSEEQ